MQFYEANPEPTLKRFALCEENSLLNKWLCFEATFPHGTAFDLIGEIDISQADYMYTNLTRPRQIHIQEEKRLRFVSLCEFISLCLFRDLNHTFLIASCELVLKIITLQITYLGFRELDIYYVKLITSICLNAVWNTTIV